MNVEISSFETDVHCAYQSAPLSASDIFLVLVKACLLFFLFNRFSGMIEPVEKGLPQGLFAEGYSRNSLVFVFFFIFNLFRFFCLQDTLIYQF